MTTWQLDQHLPPSVTQLMRAPARGGLCTEHLAIRSGVVILSIAEPIGPRTMFFDFIRYWSRNSRLEEWASARIRDICSEAARGTCPVAIEKLCFQMLSGVPHDRLCAVATDWYAEYRERSKETLGLLRRTAESHRSDGYTVALVSNSFRLCVERLADDLDVAVTLSVDVGVDEFSNVTGEVLCSMQGENMINATRALARSMGVSLAESTAYGGHSGDLDILRAVGAPRVIGADPLLVAEAIRSSWPVLAGVPVRARAGGAGGVLDR